MILPEAVDVVVIGSGAGGLSSAVSAGHAGLSVLVVEKADVFGGTTAYSGGYLWIPGNPQTYSKDDWTPKEKDAARDYFRHETANLYDAARVDAFLDAGREAVEFFEAKTRVRFLTAPVFSDYHPDAPGGRSGGRSILTAPIDGRELGAEIVRLRKPLETITFVGMMFNSSQEVNHFFNATRSVNSALYVTKRLLSHAADLAMHQRGMRLTSGNALIARLFLSCKDLDIPVVTKCPAVELIRRDSAVIGVIVEKDGKRTRILARRGVVLAAGGYPHDLARRQERFATPRIGAEHISPAPAENTGDGLRLGESVGAQVQDDMPNGAAWIPVSTIPSKSGKPKVFPHLIDRYKPGVIAVGRDGKRFVNEANSYHDFGQAMIARFAGGEMSAWLVCDHATLRKYGMGFVKPFPVPYAQHLKSGYLLRAESPAELAAAMGIDRRSMDQTIRTYNTAAERGEDPEFHKGSTAYNRFLGDPNHKPNPNVGPLNRPPYYAIKIRLGDLGTFAGLKTDAAGRVLGEHGAPVPGLFAAGNDMSSIMGGNYPGGGITLGPALAFGYLIGKALARTPPAFAGNPTRDEP